jgi:DNA-binding transcriptional LysR family regulator
MFSPKLFNSRLPINSVGRNDQCANCIDGRSSMDLTTVDAFLVLASELHFGRTAERLGLSQPRISRMIRSLEREIGGALFERTSRKVRLTPLGARLHEALRRVARRFQ